MKKKNMRNVLLFISSLLFFCSGPGSLIGAEISGTVKDNAGDPIASGTVNAYEKNVENFACFLIDDPVASAPINNGAYTITGLDAGRYFLKAIISKGPHTPEWATAGESTPDCAQAKFIEVSDGSPVTRNFQLDPGAVVTGIVRDKNGVPITVGGTISVYIGAGCPKGGTIGAIHKVNYDDNGVYSFGLAPGDYYLLAESAGYHIAGWWKEGATSAPCEQAEVMKLTAGQPPVTKDFKLDIGMAISGAVYDNDNKPVTGGSVTVYSGDPCKYNHIADGRITSGVYTVPGLPAGDYYLRAYSDGSSFKEWWAPGRSTTDCAKAGIVSGTAGQHITGIDFNPPSNTTFPVKAKDGKIVILSM